VIIWNHACERLTGVPASEVLGTQDHWRGFYKHERPCLADLIIEGRTEQIDALYTAHDALAEPGFPSRGFHAENWCILPRTGERRYLAIDSGPVYDESGRLAAVIETLRDITSQYEARRALELLATRDGLTGVANRRHFDDALTREWRRAQREGKGLAVIMADVDHFKHYNDRFGHLQGDACLKQVAAALSGEVQRPGDLVARYGGEEFVILLSGADLAGAKRVAERLRSAVLDLAIPHPEVPGPEVVTLSFGVAAAEPKAGGDVKQLIEAADRALYVAKRQGRNRVVCGALDDTNV
jgi:diguanylate cyclase (GGDEF)-like protein